MTIQQAVAQLLTDAYYRAKRRARHKWKRHARPMTWRELRALPYGEYLKTRHWQDTRFKALCQGNFTCRKCGQFGGALEVHHKTYKRLGREKPRDLRVLCGECHREVHGR